jgi:Alginate export
MNYERSCRLGGGATGSTGYLLPRLMLHTDWQLGPYVRFFGQLKSGLAIGRTGGPRPPDEDQLDLHQAFLDWREPLGEASALTLRAGRQELAYGASRLVDPREGPNVRRSFDGLRTILRAGGWSVEAFATRPVETNRYVFDDSMDAAVTFWGLYSVSPQLARGLGYLDLYYLGLDRTRAPFDQGANHETRHSVGMRWWGRDSAWDYDVEALYQWGSFGPGAIQVWASPPTSAFGCAPSRGSPGWDCGRISPAAIASRRSRRCRPLTPSSRRGDTLAAWP